jgi:Fe-S cluster assembly protein SufD
MTTTLPIINVTERFAQEYEALKLRLKAQAPMWLTQIRDEAIFKFKSLGIPTRKNENWKYTSLEKVFEKEYKINTPPSNIQIYSDQFSEFQIDDLESIRITTYNGHLISSSDNQLPNDVVICSFSKACERHSDLLKKYFSKIAFNENDAVLALNTALASNGVFIYVPENIVIEKPIHLQHIINSDKDCYYFQRNIFVIEEGSRVNFIETYHSSSKGIWSEVNDISVEKGAHFSYYKLQHHLPLLFQLSHTCISQAEKSMVKTGTYTLDSKWVRNTLHFLLNGEHTETYLDGLYITKEHEFVDNHTLVNHKMPNCYSNELYKGIMNDQSTAVFNGKVFVHRNAQKTNAYQSNKNIVLTNEAKVYTKPELEIYADDVKCSHGATTGQLDQEALFYLRARGISEEGAKALLLKAFAKEVLHTIKINELRTHIENLFSNECSV